MIKQIYLNGKNNKLISICQ